jgi:capsular exopolysaccharide synthesis family protein
MSRIHEALQKAEQERGQAMGNSIVGLPAPSVLDDTILTQLDEAVLAQHVPVEAHAAMAAAVPSPRPTPPGVDSAIAACVPTEWKPNLQSMLFFDTTKDFVAGAEQFRTLRSRLSQLREKRPLKTILVGSAMPGEGKSFIAANLAQAFVRQHGRRALLIDGDLRCARLHEYLGTRGGPGLTEFLRGTADESSILLRNSVLDGLFFIPRGGEVKNPAELIANGRFKNLLERLAPFVDWIVVDSPPAVPVADASLLAGMCDGVLLVVQSGGTNFELAQKAVHEFRERPLLGVVLNRAAAESGYGNYYYTGYGSGGGKDKR